MGRPPPQILGDRSPSLPSVRVVTLPSVGYDDDIPKTFCAEQRSRVCHSEPIPMEHSDTWGISSTWISDRFPSLGGVGRMSSRQMVALPGCHTVTFDSCNNEFMLVITLRYDVDFN